MEFAYCYGCMRELEAPGAVCPHCGYDNTNDPKKEPNHVLPCGTVLNGHYIVGRSLGQGGFGITYIGWDLNLEIPVCIKEYFPEGAAMRSATQSRMVYWGTSETAQGKKHSRESLVKEARKAVKLRNLNHVVNVWGVFYENETAYIVMDYIEGETLKSRLIRERRTLGEQECVELLAPVMSDLDKAHGLGIIHRDIKPDNLMLKPDGELVLLDMGAAKDLGKSEQNGAVQSSAMVVSHGFSPLEQYRQNGSTGPWTDVYAMSATIYYCVTGRLLSAPIDRMFEDTEDFTAFSPAFAAALSKGLAVKPEERIQSMGELLRQLKAAAGPKQEPAPKPDPKPDPEPKTKSVPEFETEPDPDSETEPEADSETKIGPVPQTKPGPEPVRVPKSEKGKSKLPWILGIAAALALLIFIAVRFTGSSTPEPTAAPTAKPAEKAPETAVSVSTLSTADADDGKDYTITKDNFYTYYDVDTGEYEVLPGGGEPEIEPRLWLSYKLKPEYAKLVDAEKSSVEISVEGAYILALIKDVNWINGEITVTNTTSTDKMELLQNLVVINGGDGSAWEREFKETVSGAQELSIPLNVWSRGVWVLGGGKSGNYKGPISPLTRDDYEEGATWLTQFQDVALVSVSGTLRLKNDTGGETESSVDIEAKGMTPGQMFLRGYAYQTGEGVGQDYAKAMEWYLKAADAGYPAAMYTIGLMYHMGRGVDRDYAKAMEWYLEAADAGDVPSMCNIGYLYSAGKGVEQDYAKAMEWYMKAVDNGDKTAMYNIGELYENGNGVLQDYTKAMEWYQKAADAGVGVAMHSIGRMYEEGKGVAKNQTKAEEWYAKAKAAGYSG